MRTPGTSTGASIAALLRHSSTALVRRYAHLSPSHLQEAVEKVAAFGKGEIPAESPTRESVKAAKPDERAGERSLDTATASPIAVPPVTGTVTGW
ncbi:hypothetical protein MYX04_12440 [Nitrospiraceae bacterium AH_259_D15_M11_P09]|nr:hypothetical protein [Nitrospiraceae bacterium AH_259_D15_M11_P09]